MEHLQGKVTLILDGSQRTLHFDYLFLAVLEERFGAVDAGMEYINEKAIFCVVRLVWLALLADGTHLPPDFDEKTVMRWLRETSVEDQQKVVAAFKSAMGFMGDILAVVNPESPAASASPGQ